MYENRTGFIGEYVGKYISYVITLRDKVYFTMNIIWCDNGKILAASNKQLFAESNCSWDKYISAKSNQTFCCVCHTVLVTGRCGTNELIEDATSDNACSIRAGPNESVQKLCILIFFNRNKS